MVVSRIAVGPQDNAKGSADLDAFSRHRASIPRVNAPELEHVGRVCRSLRTAGCAPRSDSGILPATNSDDASTGLLSLRSGVQFPPGPPILLPCPSHRAAQGSTAAQAALTVQF